MHEEPTSESIDDEKSSMANNWRDSAMPLRELAITENARRVLERRYLKKDDSGKVIETPKGMMRRVSKAIAEAERNYGASAEDVATIERKFYDMISTMDFVPNSPTLMNAGRELGQLSACFVLPIGDSIEEIFDAIKYTALIHKSGGGCTSGDSRVFTTFCGLESFEELYERLKSNGLRENDYDGRGKWIDVEELDIKCLSFNQSNRQFVISKIEKIWNYNISDEDCISIETSNGMAVRTSSWHPFLVESESKIIERRADELSCGDRIIVPAVDLTSAWPFEAVRSDTHPRLNEESSWTLGYLIGSVQRADSDILETECEGCDSAAAEEIFETILVGGKIMPEEIDALTLRDQRFILAGLNKRFFNIEAAEILPNAIAKTSRPVLLSFVAGLLDSIHDSRNEGGFAMRIADHELGKDIASLLSILGVVANVKHEEGPVFISLDQDSVSSLSKLTAKFLKNGRDVTSAEKDSSADYRSIEIVKLERSNGGNNRFYDFSVEGTNNYLAGEFGLTVVHNTGFSFSRLRPAKDAVMSTKGISSGPMSFMEVFNSATETIKQGGTRRGANMGILRVDHPDILEFISAKKDQKRLTNFNLSVALTDTFMETVKKKEDYSLLNPRTGEEDGRLDANTVFDLIVNMAWRNGEPGIVFIDRINRDNPTPEVGQIESTNPCGEQPLLPFESCNLGSINLSHHLKEKEDRKVIDWDKLKDATVWGVRFLDNVIDVNKYPLPQIEEMTKANRKIGLGVMGFADMLLELEVPFNSDEAIEIARNVMKFIHTNARTASEKLAESRGSFPNFSRSTLRRNHQVMRNATVTTIAPTGTISIIAGCSSGIEPLFAIAYTRNVMDRDELYEVNPIFAEAAKKRNILSENRLKQIAERGTIADIPEIPEDIKRLFVTSHDITPKDHVRMQAAFQEFTDNAVSKTVNFPSDATADDVREVYLMSYDLGLKGVTVYRYGSRDEQVLNLGKGVDNNSKTEAINSHNPEDSGIKSPRPRPSVTKGTTQKMETGCGKLYVTINEDERGLCEVFTQMGKSGGCTASQSEAIGRLISLALRSGIEVKTIVKQLRGIRCPSPLWQPGGMILSCSDAIAKSIERYIENGDLVDQYSKSQQPIEKKNHVDKGEVCPECPECGAMVDYVEGCVVCRSCGYSRCW